MKTENRWNRKCVFLLPIFLQLNGLHVNMIRSFWEQEQTNKKFGIIDNANSA